MPLTRMIWPSGKAAGEELGLGFGADDGYVGALLHVGGGEGATLVDGHVLDGHEFGGDAVDLPGVGVEIVLDGDVFPDDGSDVDDAGDGLLDALDVVHLEADFDAGFRAADLLAGGAGEDADLVGAELGEDSLEGAAEAGSVGEQKDDGGDAPGHAEDGDGGAAEVVAHGLHGLTEDVLEHGEHGLFLPQGFDGFEHGGAVRGVEAGDDSGESEGSEGHGGGPGDEARRVEAHFVIAHGSA